MLYDVRFELRGVLETISDAVAIVDNKWRILNVNGACLALFGYRAHEMIGRSIRKMFVEHGARKVLTSLRATFCSRAEGRATWQGHMLGRHRDGDRIVLDCRIGRYFHHDLVRYALVMRDVGPRRRFERALKRAALRDPLTGLLNRAAFADELNRAIERARRGNHRVAVLLLDLDHFKEINDSAGHQAGDLLLSQAGRRLHDQIRQSDVLARIGGDEFAVIFGDDATTADSAALAERLAEAMSRPFYVAGLQANIGTSIGIALFPQDASDGDALLSRADMALYAAKASGRSGWRLFDSEMQAAATARRRLDSELRTALRDGQLELLYQPVIRAPDLEVCGFEALIRWMHPTRGVLKPDEFLPLAERNRLIQPITDWVFDRAVNEIGTLGCEHSDKLLTAVNISTKIFDHDGLVEAVGRVCAHSPELGPRLILEVTEGALAEHERAAKVLSALRRLGVQIAIDDFGVGYSSLARLKELPLDVLKIDRSLIANLPSSNVDCAVVDAIVRLATCLDMATVAEGVETLDQLRCVIDLGCRQAQGHLFANPMAIASVPHWLKGWRLERQRLLALCWPGERLRLA